MLNISISAGKEWMLYIVPYGNVVTSKLFHTHNTHARTHARTHAKPLRRNSWVYQEYLRKSPKKRSAFKRKEPYGMLKENRTTKKMWVKEDQSKFP